MYDKMAEKVVAIIGGNKGSDEVMAKATELGRVLAARRISVVTGVGPGLPLEVARAAKEAGGRTYGISNVTLRSPASYLTKEEREQLGLNETPKKEEKLRMPGEKEKIPLPPNYEDYFDFIAYTGAGEARNVFLAKSGWASIVIGGAAGTLNEFTMALNSSKVIGVYLGTGGTADKIKPIMDVMQAENSRVVYSNDPSRLVDLIEGEWVKEKEDVIRVLQRRR